MTVRSFFMVKGCEIVENCRETWLTNEETFSSSLLIDPENTILLDFWYPYIVDVSYDSDFVFLFLVIV